MESAWHYLTCTPRPKAPAPGADVPAAIRARADDCTARLCRRRARARLLGLGDRAPGGGDPRLTPSDNKPPAGRARASTHSRRAFTNPFWAAQGPRP